MTVILAILAAVVLAFLAFKLVSGMVKFAVLAVIVLVLYLFMTSGFGA